MKRIVAVALIAIGALLAPAGAGARDWGFIPEAQAQGAPQGKKGGGPPPRAQEFRRDKDAGPPRNERQQGRMTEEERRDLQRDLDRANREIYRPAPRR